MTEGSDHDRAIIARAAADILTGASVHRHRESPAATPDHPTGAHAIARFFTKRARENAAGLQFVSAREDRQFHLYGPEVDSDDEKRAILNGERLQYVRVSWFWGAVAPLAWPLPVAVKDRVGAGLSYPFSPLGYLIYHDRSQRVTDQASERSRDRQAQRAYAWAATMGESPWAARIASEFMRDRSLSNTMIRAGLLDRRVYVDPQPKEVAHAVVGRPLTECTPTEQALWADVETAAADFGERWLAGAWWTAGAKGAPARSPALDVLLGV